VHECEYPLPPPEMLTYVSKHGSWLGGALRCAPCQDTVGELVTHP
jgi:hypothetical protein